MDKAQVNKANTAGSAEGLQSVDRVLRDSLASAQRLPANLRTQVSLSNATTLLTNLISYWKLDEASGTRNDSHGTNHLTDNNTVGSTTGKLSNAASFVSANSESLSVGDNTSIRFGDIDFTFSFWMNPTSQTSDMTFIAFAGETSANQSTVYLYSPNGRVYFDCYTSGGVRIGEVESPIQFSNSTWYHFLVWHDSVGNTMKMQINGGAVTSVNTTGGALNDGAARIEIGSYNNGVSSFMNGLIDEVGFWKRVLTEDERTRLYNSGNGLSYSSFGS